MQNPCELAKVGWAMLSQEQKQILLLVFLFDFALQVHLLFAAVCCFVRIIIIIIKIVINITVVNNNATDKDNHRNQREILVQHVR